MFAVLKFFVSLQPQNRKQLGYGVMVTLQILVLSFLVRVQIAQQTFSNIKKAAILVEIAAFLLHCYFYNSAK